MYKDIVAHANERYEDGIELGKSARPWHVYKDLPWEAMEELADAHNYIGWELARAEEEATVGARYFQELHTARGAVKMAYRTLQKIREGGDADGA